MSRILYQHDNGCAPDLGCHLPPPVFECEPVCNPCDPCESTCDPKTRARDSVAVLQTEVERCVSLLGRGCNAKQLPGFLHCIAMKVRRKGLCTVITEEIPRKALHDGSICFSWSNKFRDLQPGYYEGDIYLDGKSCITWPFHIPPCGGSVTTESITEEEMPCDIMGCGEPPCCVGEVPPLEVEPSVNPDVECDPCGDEQC
jgi:hypothetical protein